MKPTKIYIGIDPDLRKLNAAIVTDQKKPIAVFLRRNKEGKDDVAAANASYFACRLVEDVIAFVVAELDTFEPNCEIVTVVESQNMKHAEQMRKRGKRVNYQDILLTGQVAGCLMGAFNNLSTRLHLIQPMRWKGTIPKEKHHPRIYKHLDLEPVVGQVTNIFPLIAPELSAWSRDKINAGDYWDINDSLGLALYGAREGL